MKKLTIVAMLLVLIISCKDNKKEEETVKVNETVYVDDSFENDYAVSIYAKVEKNDEFSAFYLTDNFVQYFTGDQAIKQKIVGNANSQEIKITFPKDSILSRLRIDFGGNKNQQTIVVDSIKVKYEDRELAITDSIFSKYFEANKFISVNPDGKTIDLSVKEGAYDPYIKGTKLFNKELKKFKHKN